MRLSGKGLGHRGNIDARRNSRTPNILIMILVFEKDDPKYNGTGVKSANHERFDR